MRLTYIILVLGFVSSNLWCSKGQEALCTVTWVKLNTSPVCFSAKGDQPGSFTPSSHGFLKEVKLTHLSGNVSCTSQDQLYGSNWGCNNLPGIEDYPLNVFVTNKDNETMFPLTGVTYKEELVDSYRYYAIQGYDAMSPNLVLKHGLNSPSDYIGPDSKLRVWYGEDLFAEAREDDNLGTACVDVYGYFV